MRRSLIAFALVLLLSAVAVYAVAIDINSACDKLEITEDHYNSKTIVDGLQVKTRTTLDRYLLWETVYDIGEESSISTEYSYHGARFNEKFERKYDGITVNVFLEYGFENERGAEEQFGIGKAYKELYDTTPPGKEKKKTVYLKDYYEFYPMGAEIELPNFSCGWGGYLSYGTITPQIGTEEYIYSRLDEYFKIPVIEDAYVEISVSRSIKGDLIGMGSANMDGEQFHMSCISTLTDEASYFTFDAHTTDGNIVDLSYLPDGYGIYCVPYIGEIKSAEGVLIDEISMVYPLDPNIEILDIATNPEKTKLLLHTIEENKYVLTVIDIETMEQSQRFELSDWTKDNYGWQMYDGEDFIAMYVQYRDIVLLSINENGDYELEFTVKQPSDTYLDYINSGMSMDFDGEKLAMAKFVNSKENKACTFYIAVYDETGQIYYGEYSTSLNTGSSGNYSYYCRPCDSEPISIEWIK